jgi:hypothetical protein
MADALPAQSEEIAGHRHIAVHVVGHKDEVEGDVLPLRHFRRGGRRRQACLRDEGLYALSKLCPAPSKPG